MKKINVEELENVNGGSREEWFELATALGLPTNCSITRKQLAERLRKFKLRAVFDAWDGKNAYYEYATSAPLTHAEVLERIGQ